MPEDPHAPVNGLPSRCVPADDRGLAFGDGLFETMAVIAGRVRFFDRHLARLERGCRRLAIEAPDRADLVRQIDALATGEHRAVIKLVVTRGSGGHGYDVPASARTRTIVMKRRWPESRPGRYTHGIRVGVCRTRLGRNRSLAGLKTLNRLEQVLGRAEVAGRGLDEGLMLDNTDAVIEATAANLFVVRDDTVMTPDLSACGVAGVMREAVCDTLAGLGVPCRTARLGLSDVLSARELWLTNAILGITPVARFAGRRLERRDVAARVADAMRDEGLEPCG